MFFLSIRLALFLLFIAAEGIHLPKVKLRKSDTSLIFNHGEQRFELSSKDGKLIINKSRSPEVANSIDYEGIFGIFRLSKKICVACIRNSTWCDCICHEMKLVNDIEIIEVPQNGIVSDNDYESEKILLANSFQRHKFYFSAGNYDVTRTFQSNVAVPGSSWDKCNLRYFWNYKHVKLLISLGLDDFVVPVTNAVLETKNFKCRNETFKLSLISRRSRYYQGQRFLKRGSNEIGEPANFVESEQILRKIDSGSCSSFVQVRGSLPLCWKQQRKWRMRPAIEFSSNVSEHSKVVSAHLGELFTEYCCDNHSSAVRAVPDIQLVNLINKSGSQGRLGVWLHKVLTFLSLTHIPADSQSRKRLERWMVKSLLSASSMDEASFRDRSALTTELFLLRGPGNASNARDMAVELLWLDYHHKAKDRAALEQLLNALNLSEHNGALYYDGASPVLKQYRVVRTNCVDCLDRTNVFQVRSAARSRACSSSLQSMVSKRMLARQLALLLNAQQPHGFELPEKLNNIVSRMWQNMGDQLSLLYAGSKYHFCRVLCLILQRAMKRDVTVHGFRTALGLANDAVFALQRFFINNCKDEERQRGINMLTGVDDEEIEVEHVLPFLSDEQQLNDLEKEIESIFKSVS